MKEREYVQILCGRKVKSDDRHGGREVGLGYCKKNGRIQMAQKLWFLKFKISWIFQNLLWSSKSQTSYLSNIDSRVLFIGPKSSKKSLCVFVSLVSSYKVKVPV